MSLFNAGKLPQQVLGTHLYRNSIYLIVNNAVRALFGFIFWLIVARFYSEVEVGYSSAIISAIGLVTSLSQMGLNASLIRFMPQSDKPQGLLNTCFTLGGITSLVFASIFIAGINLWAPALNFVRASAVFCLAFMAFTMLNALSCLVDAAFMAKRQAGYVLYSNIVFSLLRLPLPILFVLYFRSFGIVTGWGIAVGGALAISLLFFLPRVQKNYLPTLVLNLSLIKRIWRYSFSNYILNLLSGAPVLILPVVVVNLMGAEKNAFFYIAWMMAGFLSSISGAISNSLFAEGSHFENRLKINTINSLKASFLILVPALIVFCLTGKWLLLIFGQTYSLNSFHLFLILCLSSLPRVIIDIYSSVLRVTGRINELIIVWGVMAIAVLLGSYLVVPLIGIIGIGYVWLGTQAIIAVYVLLSRKMV
jgi:O-antigen/teichoic acid export membrane protein